MPYNGLGGDATTYHKIYVEDAEAPTAITSTTDWDGRSMLAGIDWDGALTPLEYNNSPSLVTPFQSLADSYDPSAIQASLYDDGSGSGSYMQFYLFDSSYALPKIHIEFSAGGWGGEFCGVSVDEFDGVTPDEIDGV
jgi:hypothetical protein